MVKVSKLLPLCLSTLSIAASVIPKEETICSSEDPADCYPLQFVPTGDWKPIREGQHIPQGLDIRLDWQTGEKFAKLGDSTAEDISREVVVKDIIEEDTKKIVSYNTDEDLVEDKDIQTLKMAASSSNTLIDLEDALGVIVDYHKNGVKDETKLKDTLESLTEHSHNLKDGIIITDSEYFPSLFDLAISTRYSTEVRELALRVIAQALRHNTKALDNVDAKQALLKSFIYLSSEENSVLQKRILGVISSLLQTEENSKVFVNLNGENVLIRSFDKLKEDSKVRVLEILEDLKSQKLSKRSNDEQDVIDNSLFEAIQSSLAKGSVEDDHALERLFDKLVELKNANKSFKVDNDFLGWLTDHIHDRKLNKRDGEDDELHKKLLEARHLTFGNPKALRKALADEL